MKTEKITDITKAVTQFIKSTNEYDVDSALHLFASNAVIDDVSVGDKFKNTVGVRKYLETYFVGYKTQTKIDSLKVINANYAEVKVDFTGNFGHEKGTLNVTMNTDGLIEAINADLD